MSWYEVNGIIAWAVGVVRYTETGMRVRLLRMSRYATVALRSIILVRHMVRWRVGLIPVFRTWCSEIRTPSLLTGKLVLTKAFPHALEIWYILAEERERVIESELKGVTLRVYWHILGSKKQAVGVRPVQRALGLSSPSVASHHLEKLRGLGLLEKDSTGEYHLIEQVKVGVLQNFV